jgi:hypothetical protein
MQTLTKPVYQFGKNGSAPMIESLMIVLVHVGANMSLDSSHQIE